MSDTAWSEDRVITLKSLWLDGLSASQIAKQLGGVTRNAVIGKVHRLGLSGRGAAATPARAAPVRPQQRPSIPAPAPAPEGPGLVADLVELGAHACKWPIGDPKGARFSCLA